MAGDLILITGATGHLGFRTLIDSLKAGYRVRAATRNTSSAKVKAIKANPELVALNPSAKSLSFVQVSDFTAPGAFDEAVKGVKYILHIASPIASGSLTTDYENEFIKPALRGTLSLLEAAQKTGTVEKIVITSSVVAVVPIGVFQGTDKSQYTADNRVEFVPGPYSDTFLAYTMSKVAALNEAEAWYRKTQPRFDLIHVHPSLIFGSDVLVDDLQELRHEGSNSRLFDAATGKPGGQIGGSVHVSDVSRVHLAALQPQIKGLKSFGANVNIDWTQLPGILEKEFPEALKSGIVKTDPSLTTSFFNLDASETERTFGFKFIGFPDQVKESVEHYVRLAQAA